MGTNGTGSPWGGSRAPFQAAGGAGPREGRGGTEGPHSTPAAAARARPGPRGECGGSRGSGRWGQGYGGSPGGPGVTETVGCQARGRSPRRRRAIAGTRGVSAPGLRLGRARTPRPSPGPAAARKMSPGALRNGDPCWLPERLSPLPILSMRPPQFSSVGLS